LYGIPIEINNEYGAMLVNKPEFQRLGIEYPTTWDEVVDVARKTTVRRGDTFVMRGMEFTNDDQLTTTFLSMILSQGGQYWVNNRLKFTTPEAERAFQILLDWVLVDQITNTDAATEALGDEMDGKDMLAWNQVMMVPRGPWVISVIDEDYGKKYGVDFDYVKFPFFSNIQAFPAETGWSMCVPKKSKVSAEAWTYVRWLFQPENLMRHNVNCAQLPARKTIAQNPSLVRQMPYAEPLLDILQYGKFIGPFNTEVLKLTMRDIFVSMCNRDGRYANVSAALSALESRCNTDLKL
jgi:multiple sugar transport system substrate-binding protein